MPKTYRQLSLEDRCEIAKLYGQGQSIRQIAAALDCEPARNFDPLKGGIGVQN